MDNKLLKKAYAPENFRIRGHRLIDELADHLQKQLNDSKSKTLNWQTPEVELEFWKNFLTYSNESELFSQVLKRTTNVHNPKCIGHQVAPTAPITALSALVGGLLNNGMAVYEMGMAPSAIERVVTDFLCSKIGYNSEARGFLTSGGTLANLTALLAARKAKVKIDVWNEGYKESLGIMVSQEAHYCVDRAAKIMGLGEKGIIKIPTNSSYSVDCSRLEEYYKTAKKKGIHIFAIVGSAPSTATGVYDDLATISDFAKKYNLWFHVDGAHGGGAIFSKKYSPLLDGIHQADSVVIDGHKMMMMSAITTALLFKNGHYSHATFSQKADYLLEQSDHEDWYNIAKRTFECTKTMMSVHWFTMLKTYGEAIFDEYVTNLYDLGNIFGAMIANDSDFELAVSPVSNIVCFRIKPKNSTTTSLNQINADIRQYLLEDGEFYIVQTKLRGQYYMRCTIMNPFTTKNHFKTLLNKIKEAYNVLI